MVKQNVTNPGFLGFLEKLIRLIPTVYILARILVKYTNYFESDFFYLPKYFKNKKINIIDIGASDGISCKFFLRNLNVKNILCYEPQSIFKKNLKKISKKYNNVKYYNYGLGSKNGKVEIYAPYISFFGKFFFLSTYTFPKKKDLIKQIKLDFLIKPKIGKIIIKIKKFKIKKKKIDLIKIDTNGSEPEIVKSLNKLIIRDKPIFIIENNDTKKVFKLLSKYNYKKFFVFQNELKPHNSENCGNIIYM